MQYWIRANGEPVKVSDLKLNEVDDIIRFLEFKLNNQVNVTPWTREWFQVMYTHKLRLLYDGTDDSLFSGKEAVNLYDD